MKKSIILSAALLILASCSKPQPELNLNNGHYNIDLSSIENYDLLNIYIDTTIANVGELRFDNGTGFTLRNDTVTQLPILGNLFVNTYQFDCFLIGDSLRFGDVWVLQSTLPGKFIYTNETSYGLMGNQIRTLTLTEI